MIKVKATDESKKRFMKIKELGHIAEPGETFEVTEERFELLSGNNMYKACFVTKIESSKSKKIDKKSEEPSYLLVEDSVEYCPDCKITEALSSEEPTVESTLVGDNYD